MAPGYEAEALARLREKKNLRLLEIPAFTAGGLDVKRVAGGFLVQERASTRFPEDAWRVVTRRTPTSEEWGDLRFAWRAVAAGEVERHPARA